MKTLSKSKRYEHGYRINNHAPGLLKYDFHINDLITKLPDTVIDYSYWDEIPIEEYSSLKNKLIPFDAFCGNIVEFIIVSIN